SARASKVKQYCVTCRVIEVLQFAVLIRGRSFCLRKMSGTQSLPNMVAMRATILIRLGRVSLRGA
ncbi:MAG: hypothetical protein QGG09_18390, partial [Pirellulaceae bacterium]|nr:hypothetical protein [Pirellulaceae bacterium]